LPISKSAALLLCAAFETLATTLVLRPAKPLQ
jgi:hypothetical protein